MKLGDAILYLLLDDTKLKSGLAKAGKNINSWGDKLGTAVKRGVIAATAAVVGLSLGIIKLSKDAMMSAARVEELELVMEVIGKNAGVSTQKLYDNVDAIKELGITTQVALGLVTQFTRFQLDAADATKLARVAQDAAVISMSDSSEALQGLMHGITTMNTRVLRTYGITISSTVDLQDKFAESLGITRGELNQQQKIQAVLNGVLAQGETIQGAYEAAMQSSSKQLRSMKRHVVELLNSLGKPLLDAFGDVVTGATNMLKVFRKNIDEGGILETVMARIGKTIAGGLGKMLLKGSTFMNGALNFLSFIDHALKYGEWLDDWFQNIPEAWKPFAQFLAFALEEGDTLNDFLQDLPKPLQKITRVLAELLLLIRGQGSFKGLILALFGERGMVQGGPVAGLLKAFEDLSETIKKFVRTVIRPLIEEHGPEIEQFFNNLAETVIQAFTLIVTSAVVLKVVGLILSLANPLNKIILLVALLKTVWDLNLGGIQEKTAAVISWLKAAWKKFGSPIIKGLTNTWKKIKKLFIKYWPIIKQAAADGIQWIKDKWVEWSLEVVQLVTDTWEKIKGIWEEIKNWWADHGNEIATKAREVWGKVVQAFGWVKKHAEEFKGALLGIGVALLGLKIYIVGSGLVAGIIALGGVIAGFIATISWPITLLISLSALLGAAWAGNWGGIQEKTKKVIDWLKPEIENFINKIKESWDDWGSHIVPLVSAIWDTLKRIFKKASEIIGNIIETALDIITKFWDAWGPTIMKIIENTWGFIKRTFETAKENLKAVMDLITAVLRGEWKTVGEKLREIWDNTWKMITDAMKTIKENISIAIGDVIKKIKQRFKEIDWSELGRNIIRGIVQGIKDLSDLVGNTILNVGRGAIDVWDGFWGNKSPSKLMIERSKNIMEGVGVGVKKEESNVLRAFENIAKNLANAMSIAATPQAIPQGALGGGGATHNTEINPSFDFSGSNLNEEELMDMFELLRLMYGGKTYG